MIFKYKTMFLKQHNRKLNYIQNFMVKKNKWK